MECSLPNIKQDWYQTSTQDWQDWYQTSTHVVINIMVKQIKPENVRIDILDTKLTCLAKLPDGSDFSYALNLANKVSPNEMKWKVFPSKIEIKLKKCQESLWSTLESKPTNSSSESKVDVIKTYPSSKCQKKDWDKLAEEIKKEEASEKLEGEAALNQLFQKIYAESSDETKKAMNKSFLESGGTVLNTNWSEVGSKTIDAKPPDGMEFKKWD